MELLEDRTETGREYKKKLIGIGITSFCISVMSAIVILSTNWKSEIYKEWNAHALGIQDKLPQIRSILKGDYNEDGYKPDFKVTFKDKTVEYYFHKGYELKNN